MASRLRGFRLALIGWGAALTCGLAAIAAAAAAPFELPPLVQPPSGEHHAGKVIWADLVTPDLASAKRFYGALLGWTFQDIQAGDRAYTLALLDGVPVGGLVQRTLRPGERRQPAWLTFLSVPDVGEATRTIVAHGGRVLAPPRCSPCCTRPAAIPRMCWPSPGSGSGAPS